MRGAIFLPRGRCYFCFRADEHAVNSRKTRVHFFFRVEVLFFFRADKMRGAILFPRGC